MGGLPFGGPVSTEKEIETPSCSNLNTSPKEKAPREAGPSHVLPYWSQRETLRFSADVLPRFETSSYSTT
jgi:hypothetical protein